MNTLHFLRDKTISQKGKKCEITALFLRVTIRFSGPVKHSSVIMPSTPLPRSKKQQQQKRTLVVPAVQELILNLDKYLIIGPRIFESRGYYLINALISRVTLFFSAAKHCAKRMVETPTIGQQN